MDRMLASFLENATSTIKNRCLMEIVEQEIVSSVHICFLVVGHTKFTPDRLLLVRKQTTRVMSSMGRNWANVIHSIAK